MKKTIRIIYDLSAIFLSICFLACSNESSGSGSKESEEKVTSDRLILEAVEDGIKITIIGEEGWGKNTWVEDSTSNIDIFVTAFGADNKASFLYPFTGAEKTYSFRLYNQSSGTEAYNGDALQITAKGGVGYPMSDTFKNTKIIPSHDNEGKFFLRFDTEAAKFGDFFKVDIDLFTNGKACSPSFGGGILFGYPGVCSMCSYSNLYMHFSSADSDCVSGNYNKADNTREQCDNLFEKMKTAAFETYVFRNEAKIEDYSNIFCAKYELQLWPDGSDIHYWIYGDYSERCDY